MNRLAIDLLSSLALHNANYTEKIYSQTEYDYLCDLAIFNSAYSRMWSSNIYMFLFDEIIGYINNVCLRKLLNKHNIPAIYYKNPLIISVINDKCDIILLSRFHKAECIVIIKDVIKYNGPSITQLNSDLLAYMILIMNTIDDNE